MDRAARLVFGHSISDHQFEDFRRSLKHTAIQLVAAVLLSGCIGPLNEMIEQKYPTQ